MIIFPYGFYILDGKRPIHLGNDLEAREAMMSWMDANNSGHLRSDCIRPVTTGEGRLAE